MKTEKRLGFRLQMKIEKRLELRPSVGPAWKSEHAA